MTSVQKFELQFSNFMYTVYFVLYVQSVSVRFVILHINYRTCFFCLLVFFKLLPFVVNKKMSIIPTLIYSD